MKTVIIVLIALIGVTANAGEYVSGYVRSDGTYVQGYYRTTADSNPYNNYSSTGNYNPYTGQTGSTNSNDSAYQIKSHRKFNYETRTYELE